MRLYWGETGDASSSLFENHSSSVNIPTHPRNIKRKKKNTLSYFVLWFWRYSLSKGEDWLTLPLVGTGKSILFMDEVNCHKVIFSGITSLTNNRGDYLYHNLSDSCIYLLINPWKESLSSSWITRSGNYCLKMSHKCLWLFSGVHLAFYWSVRCIQFP